MLKQFCTSKVLICENFTRIFEFFGVLLSKCPSIRGKMAYVSLHKLPHSLRNKLKIYSSSVGSPCNNKNNLIVISLLLSNSSPSSTVQSKSDKELTLCSPCHNKNKNKNPHQNLPEQSVLQTWNFHPRLNSQN